MDVVAITIGVSWIAAAIVCVALAFPLAQGRIRRNRLYGVRLRQSLASDDAWFAINRFGGRRLIVWAIPMMVIGAVALFLPLQSNTALTLALGFVPTLFLIIPLVETLRFAKQYHASELS